MVKKQFGKIFKKKRKLPRERGIQSAHWKIMRIEQKKIVTKDRGMNKEIIIIANKMKMSHKKKEKRKAVVRIETWNINASYRENGGNS